MKLLRKIKVLAIILAVTLTMSVCSMGVFGLEEVIGGLVGSNDASALGDILSGFDLENFDMNSILDAFAGSDYSGILGSIIASLGDEYAGFTNNEIFVAVGKVINDIIASGGDVSAIDFNSSEIIALIGKYLKESAAETTTGGAEESTTNAEQESTTAAEGEATTAAEGEATTQAETTTVPEEAVTRPPAATAAPVYQESPIYVTEAPETTTQGNYTIVTQATVTTEELTARYIVTDENNENDAEKGITKQMIIGIVILVLSAAAVVVVAVFLKKSRE